MNVARRLREHKSLLHRGLHFNVHLQRAWNKYGPNEFVMQHILTCDPTMVAWYEQQFLDQWEPRYNLSPTAMNVSGYRHSDKSRQNMSLAAKRKFASELGDQVKRAISRANSGNKYWLGRKHSEEACRKIGLAHLGMRHRPEVVEAMRQRMSGESNHASKLKREDVDEIRALAIQGSRGVDLARRFGVTKTTISDIVLRKTWLP